MNAALLRASACGLEIRDTADWKYWKSALRGGLKQVDLGFFLREGIS